MHAEATFFGVNNKNQPVLAQAKYKPTPLPPPHTPLHVHVTGWVGGTK